ncbi:MAG: 50S ribosomal protein L11 methyltransferase [Deltaproteobacteria bacterium]|nr:50S ribosomal protein L11 methyltransferase [Deltaproteobacteria bacterium]
MWWKIHVPVPEGDHEEAAAELVELTGNGVTIYEGALIGYYSQALSLLDLVSSIVKWRHRWLGAAQNPGPLRIEPLKNENWAESWKKYFKPLLIGRRWIVGPSWERVGPLPGRIALTIDPGRAYGSGQCPTTALCLEVLEELADDSSFWHCGPSFSVLDIGTGTGILAIAAAKLGAQVAAVDNDPEAVTIAAKNCEVNNVPVTVCSPEEISPVPVYDLILANLTSQTLISHRDEFLQYPGPDALMVLSGITDQYESIVLDAYGEKGWKLQKKRERNEWVTVVLMHTRESQP